MLGWCQEQQDDDQAGSFAQLSAKERTRLAKQEELEASQDADYLAFMASGEKHFKDQQFDAAMAVFEQARSRRPLNVYPKVKIDDLRVLISKRDAALHAAEATRSPELATPTPPPTITPEPIAPALFDGVPASQVAPGTPAQEVYRDPAADEGPAANKPEDISVGQIAAHGTPPPSVVKKSSAVKHPPAVERPEIPPPIPPDGVQEEQFKDGQALVLQRTCRSGQLVQVYRKVDHAWGRTFYFMDGLSIQERVWTERFGDR